MRRTRLVLAVVAAMVTALVFAAPVFAVPPPDPGIHTTEPVHCPGVGDEAAPLATTSEKAPGKTIQDDYGITPGELVQSGQEACTEAEDDLGTDYKPGLGHDDVPGGG